MIVAAPVPPLVRRLGAGEVERFATHYDKSSEVFLGLVRVVSGFIRVKKIAMSINTF